MKTSKAPDAPVAVSPSQKKLKQARLPFKILSDVSPASVEPQARKRKLSAPDSEVASKVGRLSKENGLVVDPVVISDDESIDGHKVENAAKAPNPYVKLVDAARKKKLNKPKTQKKKKNSKKIVNDEVYIEPICELITSSSDETEPAKQQAEPMEVDESVPDKCNKEKSPSPAKMVKETVTESQNNEEVNPDIINIDNSNDSSDCKPPSSGTHENNNQPEIDSPNIKSITPKRVLKKNNSKTDADKSSLDISTSSSKLDESVTSAPSTPKQTRSSSVNSQGDELLNKSLTPKQLQRKQEFAKKRDEKEKEKQEREKKRQQEKEERDKVRKEKEDQKKKEREEKEEAKRKEREDKEEQRKKEKEEKERQKEEEKRLKEEKEESKKKEREEKDEQRKKEKEAREEERRKRQEALDLEKMEQDIKKKKAAEAFANFFVPKQKVEKDQAIIGPVIKNNMLSSFTLKADMRLAPTVRHKLTEEKKSKLESLLISQEVNEKDLYVKSLKNVEVIPLSSGKTWPLEDKDDDVMLVEEELAPLAGVGVIACETARERLRPKLLSFHTNRRPPYWGTWRKRSDHVTPRRPFGQDQKHLDYTIDSDSDWEEEAEGESLDGSAGEEGEEADDYEVDNELFVPHGYLSDEEATMDEDDVLSLSPEAQKAKLEHLGAEFESEMKKPTEKLKPRLFGLIWATSDGGRPDNCVEPLWDYFQKYAMIMDDPTPLLQPSVEQEEDKKKTKKEKKKKTQEESSPKSEKKKKTKESKEIKKPKEETPEGKKNQLGINSFLTKLKTA